MAIGHDGQDSSRWDGDWPAYGDLSALRDLFPVARRRAYLFSGGLAPAADPVRAAFDDWLERWALEPLYHRARYFEAWDAVRATLARLLGCGPESIALTDSTSRASNVAVDLVDSAEGGNVVVDSTTYPSSLYPWLLKRHRGIEIRTIPTDAPSADAFSEFIDHRTVAVSVSHVSALSGYRHDLRRLATLAHAHGALLIVDAAQSAGAVELDVVAAEVDVLTGVAMKWLLGPPGVGYLYVAPRFLEGEPPQVSYVGAELMPGHDRGRPELLFAPGARRFEVGIGNLPGFAAFLAALRLVESVGVPAIEARIQYLAGRCIEGMKSRGLAVVTPSDPALRAGVVAVENVRGEEIASFLAGRGVDVWGYPTGRLRVDPHGFNNDDDVDRLLTGLDRFSSEVGRLVLPS